LAPAWIAAIHELKGHWMDYSLDRRGAAIVVAVRGRIDESSWVAFGVGLSEAIEQARQASLTEVIIDLTELEYMSSRGLRVLTVAKREGDDAGVNVSLASPNEVMREILAISRYDKLFTIHETVEAAH
jgi:anti-sigma B factor antagonist